jgi:monofunctional biosynthetic peptidoglycan transglycosylase
MLFAIAVQILVLPFGEIRKLQMVNPTTSAFIEDAKKVAGEKGKHLTIHRQWVPLSSVSQVLVEAVVVAEDGTFWSHHGFDWYELGESVKANWEKRKAARGASTITQQLVKNLFLSPSKNPLRKMKEWVLTWYMERTLTKSRILELYLNTIQWGSGMYGIGAAAQIYFHKRPEMLTKEESVRLAAVIPSPDRHPANGSSPFVLRRSDRIARWLEQRRMAHVEDDTNGDAAADSLDDESADTGDVKWPRPEMPE